MVAFHQPHKACSNRCHQFSHSVGMATGRLRGLLSIVVNTQHHCEFCELGFEKKEVWLRDLGFKVILYQVYPKTKGKWVADSNLAVDSLMSQYSNKLTPFPNKPNATHRKKDNFLTSRATRSLAFLFPLVGNVLFVCFSKYAWVPWSPEPRLSLGKLLRWRFCFSAQPQVKRAQNHSNSPSSQQWQGHMAFHKALCRSRC